MTEWFRNVYACELEDLTILTHPTMMVREVDAGSLDEWLAVIRAGHSFTSAAGDRGQRRVRPRRPRRRRRHRLPRRARRQRRPGAARWCATRASAGSAGRRPSAGFRERGVQGALVRERMVAAQASGCDLAVATAMPAGDSARNLSRLGFTLAYCQAVMTKMDG